MENKKAFNKLVNVIVGTMRLGSWGQNFNTKQWALFVNECLEIGANYFDHADIYGDYTTEYDFGQILKGNSNLREQIHITTKCGINRVCHNRPNHVIKSYDCSKEHIVKSVEQSLKNLNTDYIDCLLLHRPDYLMDVEVIANCIEKLKSSGKIIDFGVSNFNASQFSLLNSFTPVITNQVEISITELSCFSDGILDKCQLNNVRPMAWSPLGGGAIFSAETEKAKRILSCAEALAEKYATTVEQIFYAFLYAHPTKIMVVTGTAKIERIKAAISAKNIYLTKEEWYMLWQASTGETIA